MSLTSTSIVHSHAGVEVVRSGSGRGSIWPLGRGVNMVAGVEEMIGNLLPLKEEPEDSLLSCTDLEDAEIPPGGWVLTPLLVLAPSLTPSVGWLLLSVSPGN